MTNITWLVSCPDRGIDPVEVMQPEDGVVSVEKMVGDIVGYFVAVECPGVNWSSEDYTDFEVHVTSPSGREWVVPVSVTWSPEFMCLTATEIVDESGVKQ